jgi:dynein intermediate chain
MTARFHDFSPNLIAGATYSGQVVVWDIRTKSEPVQRSPISSEGHTHPIRALSVVGSTNSHSIVTVSSDGKLCKWDTSQLLKPAESMQISYHKRGGTGIKEDVVIMSMARADASPETVYMGSENGHIYKSFTDERNMSKDAVKRYPPESDENASLGSASSIRDADISRRRRHHNRRRVDGHFGPVTAMDFHPGAFGLSRFYDSSELMLSSSVDWTCKLWDLKKSPLPLCEFQCTNDYVLDVKWSPKHPAVFAASDGEGSLQLWNLNKSTDTPVFRTQGKSALNCVRWSTNGEHIAAGSSDGTLDVYKVSGLDPSKDEASEFAKTLARISELNSVSGDVF